jgi:enoyl-CoA hydratase/carnithine racemase
VTVTASQQIAVETERRGGGVVARVVIDHRRKANALGSALVAELTDRVAALAADGALRAVVLTGAGERAFIGGADIGEMAAFDPPRARSFIAALHRLCAALRALPVPVVARINGAALGAGLEVAAACDLRIAAAHATFGMPEVRVGIPSVIEAALLPGLIGWGRTRELLLLGETIDAPTARRWGLVERVATTGGLDGAVAACLDAILRGGPLAVRAQKALVSRWEALPVEAAIEAGVQAFADAFTTDEPARMMRAFLDRRRG